MKSRTKYTVAGSTIGWGQADSVHHAKSVCDHHHLSLKAAAKCEGGIQRRCKKVNGPTSYLPLRVVAVDGDGYRNLTLAEVEDIESAEMELHQERDNY